MNPTTPRALALTAALALLAPLWLASDASARPGGGQSYSSHSSSGGSHSSSSSHSYGGSSSSSHSYGGSSSHSGGGSGTDGVTLALILLVFAVVYGWSYLSKRVDEQTRFDTTPAPPPPPRKQVTLAALQARDRDFSAVLFEDFVYALYARVQTARSDPQAMAALAPYVGDKARAALLARDPAGVKIHGVIIGKLQVLDVALTDRARVDLLISANYTAELEHGPQGYYIEERWALERDLNVASKPPVDVYSFQCPSCGGPYERGDQGRCSRCAQVVEGGRFDWSLRSLRVLNQSPTPPTLTGDVQEQGTNLPTVLAPTIDRQFASFAASDPGASAEAIDKRLREIYAALNTAWTARDLRPVRPYVSDALYNYLSYWIDAYRAQGLQNVLEHMNISRTKIARLTRDHHYDAITVRIWARGADYTIRVADGHRVSGDPRRPRAYSEYWTLIRGAKVRGAPRAPGQCPNCGAPLDRVNMAGNCEACGTHLTRGEFDWVLSKIEQDDDYTG